MAAKSSGPRSAVSKTSEAAPARVARLPCPVASSVAARRWPLWLAHLAAALFILALARPQRIDDRSIIRGEGYDLVLALDLSTSMYAEDSEIDGRRVNRLEALKPILEAFIRQRPSDRIGFVAFAGRAYTLAPLTHDHAWLARQIARLRIGLIEDGTAIGDGLGLALDRLKRARSDADAPRAGAFVILLTDGANNRGVLTPEQAAALAKSHEVTVHTVGVGRDGLVPFPVLDDDGRRIGTTRRMSDLDTAALRELARVTGGRFFRADDPATARESFAAIDRAQKVSFDQTTRILATEFFAWPATAGALLLLIAFPALLRRRP
ncbi:MAG: VWA domain-containing protein [Burkholderiales bacterium]|nr:VWA domain-containing protein [Opitutaceae bacterium]